MLLINNRILENACKDDTELRAVLGDSIGNPQLMKERVSHLLIIIFFNSSHSIIIIIIILILILCSFQVEDRIRKKGKDFRRSKTGSVVASKVTFREYVLCCISSIYLYS
jgi:hypothetical protein